MGSHHVVHSSLPSVDPQWSVPEAILQRRIISKGMSSVSQGLIKWSDHSVSLATWEDLDHLRQQFPCATIWGHLGMQEGGGNVSVGTPAQQIATEDEAAPEDGPTMKLPAWSRK